VDAITSLAWLTDARPEFTASASLEVGLKGGIVVVELDTSGTIDVAAERRRLEKDLAAAQKELASTTAKLGNADFMAKAPEAVVVKQRERHRVARDEADRITARLAGLK
jgi:valyl-tRNA synthetase